MGENPTGAGTDYRIAGRSENHPVVAVTWYEADAFVDGVVDDYPLRQNGNMLPVEVNKMVGLHGEMTRWWRPLGTLPESTDTYKKY